MKNRAKTSIRQVPPSVRKRSDGRLHRLLRTVISNGADRLAFVGERPSCGGEPNPLVHMMGTPS